MVKRAVLFFDIFCSFERLLSPYMFARVSSINKKMWHLHKKKKFCDENAIHSYSSGRILLALWCFLDKNKTGGICTSIDASIFGFKLITEFQCASRHLDGWSLEYAALGGHKKLWLYLYAKKKKRNTLLNLYYSLNYAVQGGHLQLCKFFFHLYLEKSLNSKNKEYCPSFHLVTKYSDIDEWLVSIGINK